MSLTVVDFIAISVFSSLLILIISSTIYDVIVKNKPYDPKPLFTSFSLYRNGKDAFKLETKTSKSIECFHGLRALSAFWVIAGHRINRIGLMVSQPLKIESFIAKTIIAILMTSGYAVDVFFLITGILISQSCLKLLDAKQLKIFKIYIGRYARYVPTLGVLLLFFMSSFPSLLVNGPSITWLNAQVASCNRYWWSSLLLIQNYVNTNDMCIGVTWYLSTDFQLILLSPIFILLLWKFKLKIFWLFALIILTSQIGIFIARYNNTISEGTIYFQTHFRISQFLIGISLGYIMYEREGKNNITRRKLLFGWLLTLSVFSAIEIYHETHKHQRFPEAFYASVHRIAFAGLVSWIIYVCHHSKSGGIVNSFLSHSLWQPVVRISLSIYLIHDIYIMMSVVNMEARWQLNTAWVFHIIIGDIAVSTLLGFIIYFVIEAPSNTIIKYILK